MKEANFPHEAIAVIDDILQYGRSKGHPHCSWRKESIQHHVEKAKGHIQRWLYEVDDDEDNLACVLTRMAMAVAVRAAEITNKEEIAVVIEDHYGGSLITKAPRNSRSIMMNVVNLDYVEHCAARSKNGDDTVLEMEDYSK